MPNVLSPRDQVFGPYLSGPSALSQRMCTSLDVVVSPVPSNLQITFMIGYITWKKKLPYMSYCFNSTGIASWVSCHKSNAQHSRSSPGCGLSFGPRQVSGARGQ